MSSELSLQIVLVPYNECERVRNGKFVGNTLYYVTVKSEIEGLEIRIVVWNWVK